MEKEKKYYFGDEKWNTLIKNGVLYSVQYTGDVCKTEYADEKIGFGAVYLLYTDKTGEVLEFHPNGQKDYEESTPAWKNGYLSYAGSGKDENVKVTTEYSIKHGNIEQKITVENISDAAINLKDMGVMQACHTEFEWGQDASPNVIGHHFIGGNGSHSAYYRVDGKGACLLFAPANGTALSYYDCHAWLDETKEKERVEKVGGGKGQTMLYPLASERERLAKEQGAKLRIFSQEKILKPNESTEFHFVYFWADHFLKADQSLIKNELIHAMSVPGYTVVANKEGVLCLETEWEQLTVCDETEGQVLNAERTDGNKTFYRFCFTKLGEHTITVRYANDRYMHLYYFVTEPVETLWEKRAAFIAKHQVKDDSLWYNGLLCEWNNETGVELSPDNYDNIKGWRIYEVTCDDPGLSKPAFLSTKQTRLPKQEEITALDDYIEHFVWGGLQQTTEEPYPYGIYGIPDWHVLRNSKDEGTRGKLHIWRIYDYSHIALTYYNMYVVVRNYKDMKLRLSKEEYLKRAYGTACAMFTIPSEIEDWSAYKTGLYNECVIPNIITSLKEEGLQFEADRLKTFWMRKVRYFVTECEDVFGSEYPFDTTGFETTYVAARDAIKASSFVRDDSPFAQEIPYGKAVNFMERQHDCNIACRGYLEPAYYWYGSDYRGNNMHYLLSYMSQMGGCSVLWHALYQEKEPWEMLRLGYGSLLSSYALMNTGTKESNFGYWFPGEEHDGAAGGGFEPVYRTETWLNQPSHGGSWYYSCEIDLGFCGGVRGDAVILAEDPVFGWTCYGGNAVWEKENFSVFQDGKTEKEFHYLSGEKRFHAVLDHGAFDKKMAAWDEEKKELTLYFDPKQSKTQRKLKLSSLDLGVWSADEAFSNTTEAEVTLKEGQNELVLKFNRTK